MKSIVRRYSELQNEVASEAIRGKERRKTIGVVLRRGIKRFRKAVRIVIVLLRSGGYVSLQAIHFTIIDYIQFTEMYAK